MHKEESKKVHLVVFHHGLWGNPAHLHYTQEQLESAHAKYAQKHKENMHELVILNCHVNTGFNTYDGIDVCADRLVDDILDKIDKIEYPDVDYKKNDDSSNHQCKVTQISFIGYSLGGLINRYAVGKLLTMNEFFTRIQPIHFVTFATPHLGTLRREDHWFNRIYNNSLSFLIYKSGTQMSMFDNRPEFHHLPLLYIMTDPSLPFYQALTQFKHLKCYANAKNDFSVRFSTSFFEHTNHYRKQPHSQKYPNDYPSIIEFDHSIDPTPQPAEEWTWNERLIYFGLLCIAPVLLPIWLTLMPTFMLSVRISKEIQAWRNNSPSKQKSKPNTTHDWLTEWIKEKNITLISDPPSHHQRLQLRKKMIDHLNTLKWEKLVAKLRFTSAHGSIIVRNRRVAKYPDVVQHFADHFEF